MTGPLIPKAVWDEMSMGERIETLLGRSLDEMRSILDTDHTDPRLNVYERNHLRSQKIEIANTIVRVAAKTGIESRRIAAQREAVFGDMAREYRQLANGKPLPAQGRPETPQPVPKPPREELAPGGNRGGGRGPPPTGPQ